MKIGFVGAGKVGCSLGAYLSQQNTIIGYASSDYQDAVFAADLTQSKAYTNACDLLIDCDTLFFTTPDSVIQSAWYELVNSVSSGNKKTEELFKNKNICHCSGASSSALFSGAEDLGAYVYSVHPLFAISSKTVALNELKKAYFTIEGSKGHLKQIQELLEDLGNTVTVISAEQKVRYHAAAVLASNQVVALYELAVGELIKCGFTEQDAIRALVPLFMGNAAHIAEVGPVEALTGPAERGDITTIENHLACLEGRTKQVYELLNDELLEIAKIKHANKDQ